MRLWSLRVCSYGVCFRQLISGHVSCGNMVFFFLYIYFYNLGLVTPSVATHRSPHQLLTDIFLWFIDAWWSDRIDLINAMYVNIKFLTYSCYLYTAYYYLATLLLTKPLLVKHVKGKQQVWPLTSCQYFLLYIRKAVCNLYYILMNNVFKFFLNKVVIV